MNSVVIREKKSNLAEDSLMEGNPTEKKNESDQAE